jgi:hypothetical protein
VRGRTYFPVLAEALAATTRGDAVLLAGWRADSDDWDAAAPRLLTGPFR